MTGPSSSSPGDAPLRTEPVEHVHDGETLLATIVRAGCRPGETTFVTPPEVELQVGLVVHGAGGEVAAHRHRPYRRVVERTLEVVLVRDGAAELDLYGEDGRHVATHALATGDAVLLAGGGHAFRFAEDTTLLEVKQGPYFGLEEKEYLPGG